MPKRSKCLRAKEYEGIIKVWLLLNLFLVMLIFAEVMQIPGYQRRIVFKMCGANLPSQHLY